MLELYLLACVELEQRVVQSNAFTYYRPYPKEGEGNVFSLFTTGGGGGVLQSQIFSLVSGPRSFPGGYPSPGQGVPPGQGCPASQDWDTPPGQDWDAWDTTPAKTGLPPGQPGLGYPRDRLCCGWYALCGFPQEDFPV